MPKRIPALVYHKIAVPSVHDANPNTCVSPAAFSRQMRLLAALGYCAADPAEYAKHRLGLPAVLPRKPFLLTFDDAFESVLTQALPVLKPLGWRAAVFMVSSAFGGHAFWDGEAGSPNRLLTAAELKTLLREGWAVGSHGESHRNMAELPAAELAKEMSSSKSELERAVGAEISLFAYPYGAFGDAAREAARAAGYRLAFATEKGGDGEFAIPRRIISGRSGLINFLLRVRQAARL